MIGTTILFVNSTFESLYYVEISMEYDFYSQIKEI